MLLWDLNRVQILCMAKDDAPFSKLRLDRIEVLIKLSLDRINLVVRIVELIINAPLRLWNLNPLPRRVARRWLPNDQLLKLLDDLRDTIGQQTSFLCRVKQLENSSIFIELVGSFELQKAVKSLVQLLEAEQKGAELTHLLEGDIFEVDCLYAVLDAVSEDSCQQLFEVRQFAEPGSQDVCLVLKGHQLSDGIESTFDLYCVEQG